MRLTQQKITDTLEAGKSIRGAWSLKQLKLLLPAMEFSKKGAFPEKGWKDRLIGREVSQDDIDSFIALKDRHLSEEKKKKGIIRHNEEYKAIYVGTEKYNCETCFHRKSCDNAWDKSTCCSYWYNPKSEIQGIAYETQKKEAGMPLFMCI